jgi:hypothetical protein
METKASHFEEVKDLPAFPFLLKELTPTMTECLNTHGQIGINSIPGFEHDHTLANGSLIKDWANLKITNNDVVTKYEIPNKTERLRERDFTVLCDLFKGTSFEKIYNLLNDRYILGRVRIFKSEPKTCLTWHNDGSPRLHYPMKTQPGCFMVIEDEVKHMDQDRWWMADTVKLHTAFNGSKESRIHLVAVIRGIR